jgi:hypothetical protein
MKKQINFPLDSTKLSRVPKFDISETLNVKVKPTVLPEKAP